MCPAEFRAHLGCRLSPNRTASVDSEARYYGHSEWSLKPWRRPAESEPGIMDLAPVQNKSTVSVDEASSGIARLLSRLRQLAISISALTVVVGLVFLTSIRWDVWQAAKSVQTTD